MMSLVIAAASTAVWPTDSAAQDAAGKININVACRCADPVGEKFCATFKEKIQKSVGYQLAENTSGYGMGVHFACVDMWKGIDNKLAGRMSAVSVSFTIYSDKLPGEVFEDSSVFRVGKDKAPEMSDRDRCRAGPVRQREFELFRKHARGRSGVFPGGGVRTVAGAAVI